MKSWIELLKNSYRFWLPLTITTAILSSLVYFYEKYWALQPLWQVYLVSIVLQTFCWLLIIKLNNWPFTKFGVGVSNQTKLAFVIGVVWSVIQVVWLGGWWTWLNLISQPFIYALVAGGAIHLYLISIDQINKIRHHDVG